MRPRFALAASLVAATAAGCIQDLGPKVGQPLGEACSEADSDPSTPVSFATDILAGIIQKPQGHCVNCHTPGAANPIGLEMAGLNLSSLDTLRQGGAHSMDDIAIPFMPCESIIYQKIGPAPPFGARMPFDGPPYLFDSDIQLVHDWIAEGANDN